MAHPPIPGRGRSALEQFDLTTINLFPTEVFKVLYGDRANDIVEPNWTSFHSLRLGRAASSIYRWRDALRSMAGMFCISIVCSWQGLLTSFF